MQTALLCTVLSFLGMLAGCDEPQAELSTPKTHRFGAIAFEYPKNWRITESVVTPAVHYLFVETPGDALVILQSYSKDEADGLAAFSKAVSDSATNEMPIGKMANSRFADLPDASGYSWIMETFDISFVGESIPHRRLYGTKQIGDRQVFVIFQVATEDYSKVEAGFQLIRDSLRSIHKAEQDAALNGGSRFE